MKRFAGAAASAIIVLGTSIAMAQPNPSSSAGTSTGPTVTPATLHIPEGTQLSMAFDDEVSSASATVGDEFTIESLDPITLPNGQMLPAGFKGVGEVTAAHKRGMMGKGGELSVRLDYLKIGSTHVRLRGAKGGSGNDSTGATVALVVLFGPLGLLKHGHEMVITKGQKVVAYTDQDVDVVLPSPIVGATETGQVVPH